MNTELYAPEPTGMNGKKVPQKPLKDRKREAV